MPAAMGECKPQSLHILLVDDERLSRVVVSNLLKKCGYRVTVVETGLEALQALRSTEPGTFQLLLTVSGGSWAPRRSKLWLQWGVTRLYAACQGLCLPLSGCPDHCAMSASGSGLHFLALLLSVLCYMSPDGPMQRCSGRKLTPVVV